MKPILKLTLRQRVYLNSFWLGVRFDISRAWHKVFKPRIDHQGLLNIWIKERAKRQWVWENVDSAACFDDNDRWYK